MMESVGFVADGLNIGESSLDLSEVNIISYQDLDISSLEYDLKEEDFSKEIFFIYENLIYRGAEGVFRLYHYGGKKIYYNLFKYMPGFAILSTFTYKIIARNRRFFFKVLKSILSF